MEIYPIIDTENQSTINIISPPADSNIPETPQVSKQASWLLSR